MGYFGDKVAFEPREHGGDVGLNFFHRRLPAEFVVGAADVEGGLNGVGPLVEVDKHSLVHALRRAVGPQAVFAVSEHFLDPRREGLRNGLRDEAPVEVSEGKRAYFVVFRSIERQDPSAMDVS